MTDRYRHVMDCLEVARNRRFCAGAKRATEEIERLQHEIDVQCSSEYVEKILKRNELLEKVLEAIEGIKEIRPYQAKRKLEQALAAFKEQT